MALAHTQVLSARSNKSGTTSTYHGRGYTYHLHKTAKDIWAKLQIARDTLAKFVKNVGVCNSTQLPGINVCDQGVGGWFEVFVVDERKLLSVVQFLKRLNRWALGTHVIKPKNKKHHYFVEVRRFEPTPPRHSVTKAPARPTYKPISYIPTEQNPNLLPALASAQGLQRLANSVNSRYHH
jgi:hypothetical protein